MTWPEGSKYEGQFSRGKANGEGVLQRTDGSIYRGHFVEDSMSGHGCMQWKDGVKYVGQFVANRREGIGTMTWNAGKWHTFDGTWRNGMQHGRGTLIDHSGQVFHGVFQWGKLIRWCDGPDGEDDDLPERPLEAPQYWINQDLSVKFNQRKEVSEEFRDKVQRVLNGTFNGVRTRDRAGVLPASLRLVKCHRVENSEVWARYQRAKERIRQRRPEKEQILPVSQLSEGRVQPVRTEEFLGDDVAEHLDGDLNEHYLWHGNTTPAGAIGISTDGFKLRLAGSHAGTYFGNGCYFAESSSKSDEYAREGSDLLAGVYALLLCRVTCGSLFRTTQPDENAIQTALRSGKYDAVLGDREASVGTYREFVIYEEDLAYPEYVVLYERKFDIDGQAETVLRFLVFLASPSPNERVGRDSVVAPPCVRPGSRTACIIFSATADPACEAR
eukprot:CAMPEP_0170354930 /NCGR_PEP_ID=MMETSP0117_2-20130122/374_1 /TAXON_ID=400756 /ORGANISM="Durinskia baltica, Strain CSIRO CS-38" /LENGTH=441 /DNA_ID=CAMNT_0010608939 /DNA_START=10 /DNA_END=1332 /DNA_ORIENTATION=+